MQRSKSHRSLLLLVLLALATVSATPPAAVASAPGALPARHYAGWEVDLTAIAGLGMPRGNVLQKAVSAASNPLTYLDEAARNGQKVLFYLIDAVDYTHGTVNTAVIPGWVAKVRNHPALYGYLSVKEPSWYGISVTEMRALYAAYRKADPNHVVVALLGDTPHFGTTQNPWATGIANVLWVDWYPVTYSRGYIATASTNFPKIKAKVAATTPGTPIWLMVQGHGNRAGDKRTPTAAELTREVRDGFTYLGAAGIAFYTWRNAQYDNDFVRNPKLWATARSLMVSGIGGVTTPR